MTEVVGGPGKVVTFYSYSAGAGRSMALANVAALLRKWGHSVLVVDWDLDAPGLPHYFEPEPHDGRGPIAEARKRHVGIVDIIDGFAHDRPVAWRDGLIWAPVFPRCGPLALLSAGRDDAGYGAKLRGLDWEVLLDQRGLRGHLQELRAQWTSEFDYVLIDSRGGSADVGALCTRWLADVVVVLITADEQSLSGAREVMRRTHARGEPQRPWPQVVPVLARDESSSEREQSVDWHERVAHSVCDAFHTWLPTRVPVIDALDALKLPYKPYWSFGRRLPVVLEGAADPTGLGHAYQVLARLLERNLQWETAADIEQRAQDAEHELRDARAALARAATRSREQAARVGAVLVMCLALAFAGRQWSLHATQRERIDTLIHAARAERDPEEAALLWREIARLDPDRPLSSALGKRRALAWPVHSIALGTPVSALALAPDAKQLAFAHGDTVYLRGLPPEAGIERLSAVRGRFDSLRFSPDGRNLLALQSGVAPALVSLDSRRALDLSTLPPQSGFAEAGKRVVGVSADLESVDVFAPEEPPKTLLVATLPGMQHGSLSQLGADGASFLGQGSVNERQVLLVGALARDGQSGAISAAVDVDCAVHIAALSGTTLAYQCALRDEIAVRPVQGRGGRLQIAPPSPDAGPLTQLSFSEDGGTLLALWTSGEVSACAAKSGQCATLRDAEPIAHAQLEPHARFAVTATAGGGVRVWRLEVGEHGARDWGELMASLRRDLHGCLPAAQRALWLADTSAPRGRRDDDCADDSRAEPVQAASGQVQTARSALAAAAPRQDDDAARQEQGRAAPPPGFVQVATGLLVDADGGHMLFPLAGSSASEGFRVVSGSGEVVEFGPAGTYLQQVPPATSVVASQLAQTHARQTALAGDKAALPWLVVDSRHGKTSDEWQTARPYLQPTQPFYWDSARGAHIARFTLGLEAEAGRTAALMQPVTLRFASNCQVTPQQVALQQLDGTGAQNVEVACPRTVKNAERGPFLGLRLENGALDYGLPIPRRPGPFELVAGNDTVLGYGLGSLQLTAVHLEEDRSPSPAPFDIHIPLKVEGGRLEPSELVIPAGQTSVTDVLRARGSSRLQISAGPAGRESSPVRVRFDSPLLLGCVAWAGGAIGGCLAARRLRPRRTLRTYTARRALLDALQGGLFGLTAVAAWLLISPRPHVLHDSELLWLLAGGVFGAAGTVLRAVLPTVIEWRRRAAAQEVQ